jgi:hypothetical protein
MKNHLLILTLLFVSIKSFSQCAGSIVIDDFNTQACGLNMPQQANQGATTTVNCSSAFGSINNAVNMLISKQTNAFSGSDVLYNSGVLNFVQDEDYLGELCLNYAYGTNIAVNSMPSLSGPVLGNFNSRAVKLWAMLDKIDAGAMVRLECNFWDGQGKKSTALREYNGLRSASTVMEEFNLGPISGSANLADVRAIEFALRTTQPGLDANLDKLEAVCNSLLSNSDITASLTATSLNDVKIKWQANTENEARHYEIQASNNGIDFKNIGTQLPNNNALGQYSFNHKPTEKTTFYRIAQHKQNGTIQLSNTVKFTVTEKDNEVVSAFCSGTSLKLVVKTNKPQLATFKILNQNGQELQQYNVKTLGGQNSLQLNTTTELAQGLYIITMQAEGSRSSLRFFKQ